MEDNTPKASFMGMSNKGDLTLETNPSDEVLALEESKGEMKEHEYFGLVAHVMERFNKAKDGRRNDEERWQQCFRNFIGDYGPETQFTSSEQSRAFMKITKTKVMAAYAQIVDVLFSGNKFPIGVEAQMIPEGLADSVHIDPKEPANPEKEGERQSSTVARKDILAQLGPFKKSLERVQDKVKEGPGLTPSALTWEPAKEAAKKLQKKFYDQLSEAQADKSLRMFAWEMAALGHGVYKGPTAIDKEYAKWSETGEYTPEIKSIPDFSAVSILNAYPDPDARNIPECEYFIERHRYSKSQLRELKKRPYFRDADIEAAIKDGYNYTEEYWEPTFTTYKPNDGIERFEVLEYWGTADADLEELAGLKVPKQFKDKDQVQLNVWICNGHLLRVVFNPFTPTRLPYHACPYELNPYSFFGIGVAENMEDTQLLMNGFMRMAVDNGAKANNLILEINENNLVPGQNMELHPGKIFRTQGQLGQSIHSIKFDNHMNENFMAFDKARQLADEATGIPSYSHGQGGIQGIGRTASGMSMLMGAAAQNIKAVVRNIDDYLLVPLGRDLFAFNMQFNFDKEFIGNLTVTAKGTEALMRNEVRSQKILQFLQVTANPMDAPFTKRDYLIRELAESLELEADKAVNDVREAGIQAIIMKDMMIAQGIDPNKQQGQGSPAGGAPKTSDPTGNGGGNIAPGNAPGPQEAGFTGSGGGANGGNQPKAA